MDDLTIKFIDKINHVIYGNFYFFLKKKYYCCKILQNYLHCGKELFLQF